MDDSNIDSDLFAQRLLDMSKEVEQVRPIWWALNRGGLFDIDPEDVVAEICIKIWQKRERYDCFSEIELKALFVKSVKNFIIDLLKKNKFKPSFFNFSQRLLSALDSVCQSPEEFTPSELLTTLKQELENLKQEDVRIILAWAEISYACKLDGAKFGSWTQQLANELDKSCKYVRARRGRVFERIKNQLSQIIQHPRNQMQPR